jgi:ABC-type lipoprotein release transport system permease subunit
VETFAMSSFGTVSKGVAIIGVSPAKESQKSNLPSRIKQGEYLSETDDGILIGEGLSKYLKVNIGDTIALIGQGYHGSSATGLFPVRGILNMLTVEMDNGLAYITLTSAQQFIDMPDGYSGILISVKNNNRINEVIRKVEQTVDTQMLDVYPWQFTMERLLQTAESDKAFGVIIMYILYVIVGFGILGTIIMMTNERRREFCVMISLGMRRLSLATVIAIELFIISLMGVVLAFVITLPMLHWFAAHPIKLTGDMYDMYIQYGMEPVMPMSLNPSIFTEQIVAVLVIVLLAIIYPVNNILKLKITTK